MIGMFRLKLAYIDSFGKNPWAIYDDYDYFSGYNINCEAKIDKNVYRNVKSLTFVPKEKFEKGFNNWFIRIEREPESNPISLNMENFVKKYIEI
jgi:hypothetical protein